MNASQFTHALKVIGFNRGMVPGVAVMVALGAIAAVYLYANKQHVERGLIG